MAESLDTGSASGRLVLNRARGVSLVLAAGEQQEMERRILESEVCRKLKFLNHRCVENFSFWPSECCLDTELFLRCSSAAPAVAAGLASSKALPCLTPLSRVSFPHDDNLFIHSGQAMLVASQAASVRKQPCPLTRTE